MDICVFVIYSILSVMVRGQYSPQNRQNPIYSQNSRSRQANVPQPNPQVSANEHNSADAALTWREGQAPQTWRDLVSTVNNGSGVSDVNDFLRLLVTADGRPVTDGDVFSPYETQDGKRVITGGGVMATSDECSPRNVSVRLPLNYSDSQVAYYPECTMVQRCGGCTPTQYLSCEPLYKEKIVLKVLRAVYLYPGALHMQWTGYESVEVERHLTCRPVCNLTSGACGPLKQFVPHQCKCQCRRFDRCSNEQKWDDNTCSCRCRNERPCCEEGSDDAPCTSFFDHRTCQCSLKQAIGAPVNASQADIDLWLASRNQAELPANGSFNLLTFPAQPITTTTTQVPPAAQEPACAAMPCPNGFNRRMNMGRCVCVLNLNRALTRTRRDPSLA